MADPDFLTGLHAGFGVPQDEVVDFAAQVTGATVIEIERLTVGDENEVYRLVLVGPDQVGYVRIRRPDSGTFDTELWAMEQARSAGVAVPVVLAVGEFATAQGPRAAMLIVAAPGQSLAQVLPNLTAEQRGIVLTNLGETLAQINSIHTPGVARPDGTGRWPDHDGVRDAFVVERRGQRADLVAAGLTAPEADRVIETIGSSADIPAPADPVLCHGDLHPGHAFISDRLEVCGVIDWGLWHGGSPVDDLSTMYIHYLADEFALILGGYGLDDGPAFRRRLALATINQMVGHLAWSVSIGNTEGSAHGVAVVRAALDQIAAAD